MPVLILLLVCGTPGFVRAAEWKLGPDHPRLLLHAADIASLKSHCGVSSTTSAPATASADFGMYHEDLARLTAVGADIMQAHARSDDLAVPAILHLVLGRRGQADEYSRYVASELTQPARARLEFDGLLALDWCWDALEPSTRAGIIERFLSRPEAIEAVHSPLDHFPFIKRLESFAAAIVVSDSEARTWPALAGRMQLVREAATEYFGGPFPLFCRQRGAMPTSPAAGVWEEVDIALACELWRSATGQNLLGELRESAGRMLDHYFYADTEHPALEHGFIHDDGSTIPLRPGQTWRGFVPAVPFALARYARSPIAAWYAVRALPVTPTHSAEIDRYLWARLVYGPWETREAPRRVMPLSRVFGGGWVAMRSGWSPGETVLLFDAGQPFWRSRQHYDAGQFQIYRKGRLAIDAGDDVTFQAITDQGGQTLIGDMAGDWDNYAQATIAHNDVTVVDRKFTQTSYGRDWLALGNQRLIERDYTPVEGDIAKTARHTGELTAFETNLFYSYAAADLTPAYPPKVVRAFSRRILFLHAGAVVVLDRVRAAQANSIKTWHLQLPARPVVLAPAATHPSVNATPASSSPAAPTTGASTNSEALSKSAAIEPEAHSSRRSGAETEARGSSGDSPKTTASPRQKSEPSSKVRESDQTGVSTIDARQLHGASSEAGIWELSDDQNWLSVINGEGKLFVRTLLPEKAHRRLIGGPMRPRKIQGGPLKGQTYFGGDPGGYEYRLWPASFLKAPSAAYELGLPLGLGPQFGVGAAWGRYDVSPAADAEAVTFLHVLAPTDAIVSTPPAVRFESSAQAARVSLVLQDQVFTIDLSLDVTRGKVTIRNRITDSVLLEKELETVVKP